MTGEQLYKKALALLFEQDSDEYRRVLAALINLLLAECALANNTIRIFRGKEPLEQAQQISSAEEELTYEPEILEGVLPYGLASKLIYDDGDMNRMAYFQAMYVNGVNSQAKAVAQDVRDEY